MLIKCIHFILIGLLFYIPYINITNNFILFLKFLYLLCIPVLWIHWIYLHGKCSLFVLDNYLHNRDRKSKEGILYKILHPFFVYNKNNKIIWCISILLWIITLIDFTDIILKIKINK